VAVTVLPELASAQAADNPIIVPVLATPDPSDTVPRARTRLPSGSAGRVLPLASFAGVFGEWPRGHRSTAVLAVPFAAFGTAVPFDTERADRGEMRRPLWTLSVHRSAMRLRMLLVGEANEVDGVVVERVEVDVMNDVPGRNLCPGVRSTPHLDMQLAHALRALTPFVRRVVDPRGAGLGVGVPDEPMSPEVHDVLDCGHASIVSPCTNASTEVQPRVSVHTLWSPVARRVP